MDGLKLLLIGGAAAAGKTTAANAIAPVLGLAPVDADSVWHALQAATTRDSHPPFHYFEPTEEEWRQGPDFLCERHIAAAEAMTPALDAFVDRELHDGHALLFEGAWLTPDAARRRLETTPDAAAVFIHEADEAAILLSMVERQKRTTPSERQLRLAPMAWRYGNWLRDGALERGLPVVDARPRDTLVPRILKAIEQ